jgi:SAM-dependent MidA family methyltransferase
VHPIPTPDPPTGASAEFLAVFRAQADSAGTMPFAKFMQLALYHPAVGYYCRPGARVGYGRETDFFTASTSGPIFGELVAAACVNLLGGANPRDFTFVEIGVEPAKAGTATRARGILAGCAHPFARIQNVGCGEPIQLRGRCVVFSNELFDAQPFHRFVFRGESWRQLGVQLRHDTLAMVELPECVAAPFSGIGTQDQVLDAPLAARDLAGQIARQPWTGLFVAIDYGKSWPELLAHVPDGTARAYFRHRQSNELLARPGEQDLTCHICWDWIAEELVRHGFDPPKIETQEAFFVYHAGKYVANTSAAEAARFSPRKLALAQLLHPAHLGQKFQVLHSRRTTH